MAAAQGEGVDEVTFEFSFLFGPLINLKDNTSGVNIWKPFSMETDQPPR